MIHSLLNYLLASAVTATACLASDQTPESIRDLETAYNQFCTKRGTTLLTTFSKRLLALQQQAIGKSDFEKAKQIQIVLGNLKKDILSPPSTTSIDAFFIEKPWAKPHGKKHYVDSSLRLFKEELNQMEFLPSNERVDPKKSSQEILVFASSIPRIWLKKDNSTVLQVYANNSIMWFTVQDNGGKIGKPAGEGLNDFQQEFRTEYAKACKPLTQKYLEAVEKRQKQLIQRGSMEEAIAIHNYMKQFQSGSRQADQTLNGIWKNQKGDLYDFSNKSKVAVKNPGGSLKFYLNYTSTSPAGEWKMARMDRGPEKDKEVIIFSAEKKIYIVNDKPSNTFSILERVSGS